MIYQLPLHSAQAHHLIPGQTYLCGRINLSGDTIDWTCREFDGQTLRLCTDGDMLGPPTPDFDERFMASGDGSTDVWLIFELPKGPNWPGGPCPGWFQTEG